MLNNICATQNNTKHYQPIIDLKEQILQIKKLLRLRMNGVTSTFMRKNGLNYKLNYGLDAMSIRGIANQFEPNTVLAETLWGQNARECKILGTLLYPKSEFTPEKADMWLTDCFLQELMEQLCFNLLQHLDFAPQKALEWIGNEDEKIRTAGYTLLLRLILGKKNLPDLTLALSSSEKDSHSENFRLEQSAIRFQERAKIV